MFKIPEGSRVTHTSVLSTDISYGRNGYFKIKLSGRSIAHCIVSDGEGWEHVSVHMSSMGKDRTPTWSEMCRIKDLFWDDTDCVIQYHPPKSEYVNNHPHCLHLWKPTNFNIPTPDSILVGFK